MTTSTEIPAETERVQADVNVLPYIQASPKFRSECQGAFDGYLASFLSDVERFVAERPESVLHAVADFTALGPVVPLTLYFSVHSNSPVAAALTASNALPLEDEDGFDQEASWAADTEVTKAVNLHLSQEARASGRLFRFICEDANFVRI